MRLAKWLVLGSMLFSALILALVVCILTFRFALRVAGLEDAYRSAFPETPDPQAAINRELGSRVPYDLQEWIWIQMGKNGRLDAVSELIDPKSATAGRRIHREGRVFHLDLSDLGLWRLEPLPPSPLWSIQLDLDDNAICSEPAAKAWLDTIASGWSSEQLCSPRQKHKRARAWLESLQGARGQLLSSGNDKIDSLSVRCVDSTAKLRLDLLAGAGLPLEKFELSHCALERQDVQFLSQLRVGDLRLSQVLSPTLDLSQARGLERIHLDSGKIEWFVPPHDLVTESIYSSTLKAAPHAAVSVRGLRLEHPFTRSLLAELGVRGDASASDIPPPALEQAWILDSLWNAGLLWQELSPTGDFDTIRLLLGDPQRQLMRVAGPVKPLQRPCPAPLGPNSHDPFYHSLFLVGPDIVRIPAGAEFAVGDFQYPLAKDTLRPGLKREEVRKVLGRPAWVDGDWLGYAHRKPFSGRITLYLWLHFDAQGKLDGMRETSEAKEGC
ncbi:MAG: hypothetical protein IPK50_16185 [Fibrobacterota bacterium]|nr:hypothetical protein [Fibrobacterota bacterium]QQS03824.1 MAG: hypothetical protein IPK50_16185 [Fibrobacterota bacterium]